MRYLVVVLALFMSCAPPEYRFESINGPPGPSGAPGVNGHSAVFTTLSASVSQCSNGGTILVVAIDLDDNGQLDTTDGNIQTVTTCNGLNGADGQDGQDGDDGQDAPPTALTPVALLNPCGDAPSIHDEVLIKLADGTLLASFSDNANGANTRFSLLTAGNYRTTDGDNCTFTVDASGAITNESHHY